MCMVGKVIGLLVMFKVVMKVDYVVVGILSK